MATVQAADCGPSIPNMIETLPHELFTKVLEFCLLPERLNVARCNKSLDHIVTQQCQSLWVHIDFEILQNHKTNCSIKSLTDHMLAVLLTRVNARVVTKRLTLKGCNSVTGTGLEPLRASRVLEQISLPFDRPQGEEAVSREEQQLVVDILRSMLPYRLFAVDLPGMNSGHYATGGVLGSRRASFTRDLHAAMHRRAREQGTKCASCYNAVYDKARQLVPNVFGLPSTHCGNCHKPYCLSATCSVSVKDCDDCGSTSCRACDGVRQCATCHKTYCEQCEYVSSHCIVCDKCHCIDCFAIPVYVCTADSCNTVLCVECEGQTSVSLQNCAFCGERYCTLCGPPFAPCDRGCGAAFCEDCDRYKTECFQCDRYDLCCSDCSPLSAYCDICERVQCTICEREREANLGRCEDCHSDFCHDCRGDDGHCSPCFNERPAKRSRRSVPYF